VLSGAKGWAATLALASASASGIDLAVGVARASGIRQA